MASIFLGHPPISNVLGTVSQMYLQFGGYPPLFPQFFPYLFKSKMYFIIKILAISQSAPVHYDFPNKHWWFSTMFVGEIST
jgi:hypothetical protein